MARKSTSSGPTPRKKRVPADPVTAYARDVVAGRVLTGRPVRLACERHLRDLEAGPARGLRWDLERAKLAIRFFADMLVMEDDRPFVLHPFQCFIVGSIFGWYGADGFRRFRTAYVEAGKGNGKALALDTLIPTPAGWTTMEQIHAGDVVFDDAGRPTEVLEAHPIQVGHPCYRVTFDDGASIVADAEHLWVTEKRKASDALDRGAAMRGVRLAERGRWRVGVRTTEEIARTLTHSNGRYQSANHSVLLGGALQLPDADLPVSPYVLGAWLGDGDGDCARITIGAQDAEDMTACVAAEGEPIRRQGDGGRGMRYIFSSRKRGGGAERVATLSARLRAMGLFGCKHIPPRYLRASRGQRLALLQGLCDTDGSALGRGQVEFTTTLPLLARGVHELMASLGIKVSMPRPCRRKCNGRPAASAYRFMFSPPADLPVFRLKRKRGAMHVETTRRRLSQERRIVACEPVESIPVRCIRVASPSGLFLAGRSMVPTHNTPTAAGIGLYGLIADGQGAPEVYSAATTRDQAKICWLDADGFVERDPELAALVDRQVGSLAVLSTRGVFRPVSAEHKGLDGKRVHMALVDELHEHPTDLVVNKIRAGTKNRRNALVFEITNSGFDRTSVCWHHHEYSLKLLEGSLENDAWFAYVCALDEGDAWTDEAVWVKANPGLDTIVPRQYLREQVTEAIGMPSKENLVRRLNFCEWTEQADRWLDMALWNACPGGPVTLEMLAGRECNGGLDGASVRDLFAFALLFGPDEDGFYDAVCRFWIPEKTLDAKDSGRAEADRLRLKEWARRGWIRTTRGDTTDYDVVEADILADLALVKLKRLSFDRWGVTQLVTHLRDALGKERVVDFGQTMGLLSAPTKELEKVLRDGKLRHGGNPVLQWMMSNAALAEGPNGQCRPDRERSGDKIDGVMAVVMALDGAMRARPANDDTFTVIACG